MRHDATVGTRSLLGSLRSLRSRALDDPPTGAGLVLAYVIMLVVLVAAVFGSAFLVGLSAWGSSVCLPSGHPLGSPGSVTAAIVGLGAVLVAYCIGCAAYMWSVGAAVVHSRVWLGIAVVMVGVVALALATVNGQTCS